MTIIGVTGPIGHGKTTLSGFLAQLEPTAVQAETSEIISEVADRLNKFFLWDTPSGSDIYSLNRWLAHLPAILAAVTHTQVNHDDVLLKEADIRRHPDDYQKLWEYVAIVQRDPSLLTEHISVENKASYRAILQWLGGYLVKHVDEGIWYNELIYRARQAERTGCKLFIISGVRFPSDGIILHRAGGRVISIIRPQQAEADTSDPTERERSKISVSSTIYNNGSLDDLMHCTIAMYHDLLDDALKPSYKAAVNVSLPG